MKTQLILWACVAGLMLVPTQAADSEPSALGKQMAAMNSAFKVLMNETDPAKGAALAREAQTAALKSAMEVPDSLKNLPEGLDKAKALVEHRKMIGKLYLTLCDLEEAFIDGKTDEVAKIVASLKDLRKAGHGKFVKDEE